ncbi:ATP-binding cassette domain-containing protein [Gemella cuniculi]|uniref:ATP-binding cassette domain-containing protein n=1 Tax=Gemella cuniculi TaxID=150240 RepID=UPI00041D8C09|nr:ABC transporter ATP-binding protein [Gemella cuniculi]
MLEIKNGYKKFNGKYVLENISIKFENGKIYGVVGENGKGKTVLLKVLCGYSVLNKGEVYQDNVKLRDKLNFIQNAGIVIEKPDFIENFTLYENLDNIRKLSDNKNIDIDFWIEFYDLVEHKDKKYKKLSLGTKQKLLIIQAFMTNPSILILDECFSGLDEKSYNKTKEYLKNYINEDRLIILTSHIKEDIEELCDEVIQL